MYNRFCTIVSAVVFSHLSTTTDNRYLTATYKIQSQVPVAESTDRLKTVLCKQYGNPHCIEKFKQIKASGDTLRFSDPILYGTWNVLLYHVKSGSDTSLPSLELSITRSTFSILRLFNPTPD